MDSAWFVYVLRSADGALYTGITTDIDRRLAQHEAGTGAKALRGRGPLELAYRRRLGERGLALRVEHRLKGLSKARKEALIARGPTRARLLKALGLE
jgi:putative endonuclease